MEDAAVVLDLDGIVVEFPGGWGERSFRAVDHVSLQVHRGEVLGLVGESGSGKSTWGRVAVGLQQPTSGTVRVGGELISSLTDAELRPFRRRFGFVFQDPAASLNPTAQADEKVRSLLDSVELPRNFAERYPHELSGGQRQRISLARALALDPDLLMRTSRPRPWTSRSSRACSTCSSNSSSACGSRACSSHTTSRWSTRSPTGWP